MTGMLPYLKSLYGDTVDSYSLLDAVFMQSNQWLWDKDRGGVIGEDDEFISSMSTRDSWEHNTLDKPQGISCRCTIHVDPAPTIKVNKRNVVSREMLDTGNNTKLPSLYTKTDEMKK